MRTPCQDEPELWVSDNVADRTIAARKCSDCPAEAFRQCAADARRDTPRLGVYAGIDYHHGKRIRQTKTCAQCGLEFSRRAGDSNKVWEFRRFCGKSCAAKGRRDQPYEERSCEECGTPIARKHESGKQWARRRFCSVRCCGLFRRAAA